MPTDDNRQVLRLNVKTKNKCHLFMYTFCGVELCYLQLNQILYYVQYMIWYIENKPYMITE